jgi:hypothetical protein
MRIAGKSAIVIACVVSSAALAAGGCATPTAREDASAEGAVANEEMIADECRSGDSRPRPGTDAIYWIGYGTYDAKEGSRIEVGTPFPYDPTEFGYTVAAFSGAENLEDEGSNGLRSTLSPESIESCTGTLRVLPGARIVFDAWESREHIEKEMQDNCVPGTVDDRGCELRPGLRTFFEVHPIAQQFGFHRTFHSQVLLKEPSLDSEVSGSIPLGAIVRQTDFGVDAFPSPTMIPVEHGSSRGWVSVYSVAPLRGTAVTTEALNLREYASVKAPILVTIPKGAVVELTGGSEGQFLGVVYGGRSGLASARYLTDPR